eukprot:TRINITY_DN19610_c0_g1_i1.p1 TRINITY_DN19610_c0_g1~~TRINITY_DN19610_c0_g1_i1.p1  ORF type:complete len:362 (+),score=84.45 TRINITY_DN19610_c0_g1_i1:73-1086(+)
MEDDRISEGRDFCEACEVGNFDLVKELLEVSEDSELLVNFSEEEDGHTPLYSATIGGHADIVVLLIKYGAKMDILVTNDAMRDGSILHCAVEGGHENIVKILVDRGANVNQSDYRSVTPLHVACRIGIASVVRKLIDAGANPNVLDAVNGSTPLHICATYGNPECAEILLQNGASVNARCVFSSFVPLHEAAYNGNILVVRKLIEYGANVNIASEHSGATPLHLATCHGHDVVVKMLLTNGAFPSTVDKHGVSALHWAARKGATECAKHLIAHKADINPFDRMNGSTPLHGAVVNDFVDIALLLLEAGAIDSLPDKLGRKAFELAASDDMRAAFRIR